METELLDNSQDVFNDGYDSHKLSVSQLASILQSNQSTIRIYLCGWIMSKYFDGKSLSICQDSINRFYTLLENRLNYKASALWKRKFKSATYIENIGEKI